MTIDDVLADEDRKWRSKQFNELASVKGNPQCYLVERGASRYQLEVDIKQGKTPAEVIVTIECCRDSFLGHLFFGRASFFAKGENSEVREIQGSEAF